jgi:hypothetical protein
MRRNVYARNAVGRSDCEEIIMVLQKDFVL